MLILYCNHEFIVMKLAKRKMMMRGRINNYNCTAASLVSHIKDMPLYIMKCTKIAGLMKE